MGKQNQSVDRVGLGCVSYIRWLGFGGLLYPCLSFIFFVSQSVSLLLCNQRYLPALRSVIKAASLFVCIIISQGCNLYGNFLCLFDYYSCLGFIKDFRSCFPRPLQMLRILSQESVIDIVLC